MLELTTFFNAINWPATLSTEGVAAILLAAFGLFSGLEWLSPHRNLPKQQRSRSYRTNLGLFAVNNTLLSLVSASSMFMLAEHYAGQGLLRHINQPIVQFVLAFVLLDLLLYAWHRLCHRFDCLWLFHRVHHNDPYLNTSTALRVHILELLLTHLLKAAYIVLLGVDQFMMMANEMLITLFTLFHHTNITFYGEKWLGKLIIVPALHRTHHSAERHEHDSNYGAVLSIWDSALGTLKQSEPTLIGIHGNSPQELINLFRFGFNLPSQAQSGQPTLPANVEDMIAEAAYYRAEKRNFSPGHELLDWLEAKNEILKLIQSNSSTKTQQTKYGLMVLN